MKARSLARELALLTLFQLEKQGKTALDPNLLANSGISLREMMLTSVRTLAEEAEQQIKTAAEDLAAVSRFIVETELNDPVNLESPLEAEAKPVPIPTTREMVNRIEQCLQGAEYLFEALRIPEMVALSNNQMVSNYATFLIRLVTEHQRDVDELVNRHSTDWRVDRMSKMDRYILRLAAAEMKYAPEVDLSVSINEAVDLAKRFSGEESFRLINGILGAIAETLQSNPEERTPLPADNAEEASPDTAGEASHV